MYQKDTKMSPRSDRKDQRRRQEWGEPGGGRQCGASTEWPWRLGPRGCPPPQVRRLPSAGTAVSVCRFLGKTSWGVQVRGPPWSGRKSDFAAGLAACGEVGQPRTKVPR